MSIADLQRMREIQSHIDEQGRLLLQYNTMLEQRLADLSRALASLESRVSDLELAAAKPGRLKPANH
jgi:hypothetical protein